MKWWWLLNLVFAAAAAHGQSSVPAAQLRVEGIVRDRGSGQPIANARVAVVEGNSIDTDRQKVGNLAATTGFDGRFVVLLDKPGRYVIAAEAPGYVRSPGSSRYFGIGRGALKTVTADLDLWKSAAITGRVVNPDTKKPVGALQIQAMISRYDSGALTFIWGARTVTSAGGDFRLDGLAPGAYFLEITSTQFKETILVGGDSSAKVSAPPHSGYRRHFWPGDQAVESTLPLEVRSGEALNIGDIPAEAEPFHQIKGLVRGCSEGEQYDVRVYQQYGQNSYPRAGRVVPCDSPFAVSNLSPGQYWMSAQLAKTTSTPEDYRSTKFAFTEVQVQNFDREVELSPVPPTAVPGKVEFPETWPGSKSLSVQVQPARGFGAEGLPRRAAVSPDGSFQIAVDAGVPFMVSLYPMPSSSAYYISDVLYNGSPLKDGMMTLDPGALAHSLTIRVSDKAATFVAKVLAKGEPVARAEVLLVPWPLRQRRGFPVSYSCFTDEEGTCTISRLPPDTYHALSVPSSSEETSRPGVLAALAARAIEVVLEPASRHEQTLEFKYLATRQ